MHKKQLEVETSKHRKMEWVSNEEARSKEKLEGKKAVIESKHEKKDLKTNERAHKYDASGTHPNPNKCSGCGYLPKNPKKCFGCTSSTLD
jgi:DNA polymerase II large subunit